MAERIVRVPLPVRLIQDVDEIVEQQLGGYNSRAEFIRESIEAMSLEVRFGVAPDERDGDPSASGDAELAGGEASAEASSVTQMPAVGLSITALEPPPKCQLVTKGCAQIADEVLFGLHNRDYPSLWAAAHLGRMTKDELVPAKRFFTAAAEEAWSFAKRLIPLETESGQKLTGLFPTNRDKPESSEGAFLSFAIGTYDHRDETIRASGALFNWRVAQLVRGDGELLIGLTPEGYELLQQLAGLSLDLPHDQASAEVFFNYLRANAPADAAGFDEVLKALSAGLTRRELVEAIAHNHGDWTETVAATNAAGYVARAREWGLVARKQAQGRYVLTDLGQAHL